MTTMKIAVNSVGTDFSLAHALLVYQSAGDQRAYVTKHPVALDNGRPVVRPGRPLTEGDYKELIGGLKPKDRPAIEWQDPSILARGMGRMIWWTAPKHRAMFFKASSIANGTFDGNAICPNPGLVFMSTEDALYVYAFRGAGAPTRETALAQAPFFNVWSQGKVCVGSARVPSDEQKNDPSAWERFFFGSLFTHPNFGEKDRLTRGVAPAKFWQAQVKKPTKTFPEKVLVDLNIKVADLLAVDFLDRPHTRATGEF